MHMAAPFVTSRRAHTRPVPRLASQLRIFDDSRLARVKRFRDQRSG